jgi:hypothetical protein
MDNLLRERVQQRLSELDMNPFEAARLAKFERSFVNDLLIGKKTTIRQSKLPALADALDCDPEFLTGLQGAPRAGGATGSIRLAGALEAGAWRGTDSFAAPEDTLPLAPDPRYPAHEQEAYLVRGDHAAGLGVNDGSVVTVFTGQMTYRDRDVVVVERRRDGNDVELTLRVIAKDALALKPGRGLEPGDPVRRESAKIVGLVLSAHRVFGLPS